MKSRMRSRSASTWGLGLKSICLASSPRVRSGRTVPRSAPPVAGEELAVVLQQPSEFERHPVVQLALEDARRRAAAAQLRRDREEELVDEAGCLQRAVKGRATLAEQRPDAFPA